MKRTNMILCVVQIALPVGAAIGQVGRLPEVVTPEPYSWTLPLIVLALTGFPALFGYLAGRDDAKSNDA